MNINSEELVVGSVTAAPQRLTGLDRLSLQGWLPRILIWNCQLDIKLLISSLKKAIDLYPYVAGRLCSQLDTHDFIIANNKGVKFTVDSYNKKIPIDISKETIDIYQYDDVDELAHQVDPESVDENTPLLQIKLSMPLKTQNQLNYVFVLELCKTSNYQLLCHVDFNCCL